MKIIPMYRYIRADGGTTVSPNKPDCEYTEMYRLVADEGKALTNGEIVVPCIDVYDYEYYSWREVYDTEEAEESI